MKKEMEFERLLNRKELGEITGMTASFIEKAYVNYGMPYYKIGRNIKFRLSEVNKWISQRKRAS